MKKIDQVAATFNMSEEEIKPFEEFLYKNNDIMYALIIAGPVAHLLNIRLSTMIDLFTDLRTVEVPAYKVRRALLRLLAKNKR